MDRLASLEAFHRVVDEGGFAAAARSLRLSPAMVSKHVNDLEARLGVRLLQRTTRRITLTDAGTTFYAQSRLALGQLAEAEKAAATNQREPTGTLRVTAPGYFGERYVAPALPEFAARYPELGLEITCDDRVVDLVADRFDVGLRIGRLPDSALVARKLARVSIVVCAAPSYLAKRGLPTSLDDLVRHSCLRYDYQWAEAGWEFRGPHGSPPRMVHLGDGPYRSNNAEVLRNLAIAGHGLVQLPDFAVASDIRAGRLVAVLDESRPEDRWVHAVFPPGRYLPASVRAFVDFFADRFGQAPPWLQFS